jgi:heme-degrading monooxygenase HmoA
VETVILFYECEGPEARARLQALQAQLAEREGWLAGELLKSTQQPELYLLKSTWRAERAPREETSVPEGTKVWRFRPVTLAEGEL